jgi:hypothetical protein
MDTAQLFENRRDAFFQRTLWSSGGGLLLAAASRLPSWEVSSPVGWLVGTVNVAFLPVFGPILVFGAFCITYLALRELNEARVALRKAEDRPSEGITGLLVSPAGGYLAEAGTLEKIAVPLAALAQRIWIIIVPILAYVILLSAYFDFVRPTRNDCREWRYPSRSQQIGDLLLGLGGWQGFAPCTPSIKSALFDRAKDSEPKERERLVRLAANMPWIYPPWQTWLYLIGLLGVGLLGVSAWRDFELPARSRRRSAP